MTARCVLIKQSEIEVEFLTSFNRVIFQWRMNIMTRLTTAIKHLYEKNRLMKLHKVLITTTPKLICALPWTDRAMCFK